MPSLVTIEGDCVKAFRLLLLALLMTGASAFTIGAGGAVAIGVGGLALFGLASLVQHYDLTATSARALRSTLTRDDLDPYFTQLREN